MNLDKYKLPNFFIRKKYKNKPGTFNFGGKIFYAKMEGDRVKNMWGINIDFPGRDRYLITKMGTATVSKEFFEDNFYHINRLQNWKKQALIRSIFSEENKDSL